MPGYAVDSRAFGQVTGGRAQVCSPTQLAPKCWWLLTAGGKLQQHTFDVDDKVAGMCASNFNRSQLCVWGCLGVIHLLSVEGGELHVASHRAEAPNGEQPKLCSQKCAFSYNITIY